MKIYTLIPARMGSKRLPRKNVQPVLGKSMIIWAIEAALTAKMLDKEAIYVSTENRQIAELCRPLCKVLPRPLELAGDVNTVTEVARHLVREKGARSGDVLVILQANSPEVEPVIIDACVNKLLDNGLHEVHTVGLDFINNGAVHVLLVSVLERKGKASYNGVVVAPYVDVHTIKDLKLAEQRLIERDENHS